MMNKTHRPSCDRGTHLERAVGSGRSRWDICKEAPLLPKTNALGKLVIFLCNLVNPRQLGGQERHLCHPARNNGKICNSLLCAINSPSVGLFIIKMLTKQMDYLPMLDCDIGYSWHQYTVSMMVSTNVGPVYRRMHGINKFNINNSIKICTYPRASKL